MINKKIGSESAIGIILIIAIIIGSLFWLGNKKPKTIDPYKDFSSMINNKSIVFLGDSITAFENWQLVFLDSRIVNAGIAGNTTDHIISRLGTITKNKPAKIFVMIGINDLLNGQDVSHVTANYEKIVSAIRIESPDTIVYVQSILPINNDIVKTTNINSSEITDINEKIKTLADGEKVFFIDVYSSFCSTDGKMYRKYAWDGLHPSAYGYLAWKNLISPFVR